MKRTLILSLVTMMALALSAFAGTLSGKVTGAKNAVVYIDTGKPTPATGKTVTMDQRGMQFKPHVLPIQLGTTVEFLNSDSVAHNVYWPSIGGDKKLMKSLGTWPQGQKKSYTFEHAGVVPVLCQVHPEMSGYIIVSPSPYYAQTDAEGNYKIENVPDGDYKVDVWGEGAKTQSKPQKIAGDTKADFTLSK